MAEPQWHWTEAGRSAGPGTLSELAGRAAGGQVGPDDLVWAPHLPVWAAARDVPAVSRHLPAGGPVAAADPLGYYPAAAPLPPRAAAALRGHAPPTGDAADWPLDDARVAQLAEAATARRPIAAAARLFRGLAALCWATTAAMLVGLVAVLARPGPRDGDMVAGLAFLIATVGGGGVVSLWAARSAGRSGRGGPVTMLVLFLLAAAIELTAVAVGVARRGGFGMVAGNGFGLALLALGSARAARAAAAVDRYRRQPAWCQEVIARVE